MEKDNADIQFGDRVKLTGTRHVELNVYGHIVKVPGYSVNGDNEMWFAAECETCGGNEGAHQLITKNNSHGGPHGAYRGKYTGEVVSNGEEVRQKRNSYTTLDDPKNMWIGEPMASGALAVTKQHRMGVGEVTNDGAYVGHLIDHPNGQLQPAWMFHTPEQLDDLITALQYARLAIDNPNLRNKE